MSGRFTLVRPITSSYGIVDFGLGDSGRTLLNSLAAQEKVRNPSAGNEVIAFDFRYPQPDDLGGRMTIEFIDNMSGGGLDLSFLSDWLKSATAPLDITLDWILGELDGLRRAYDDASEYLSSGRISWIVDQWVKNNVIPVGQTWIRPVNVNMIYESLSTPRPLQCMSGGSSMDVAVIDLIEAPKAGHLLLWLHLNPWQYKDTEPKLEAEFAIQDITGGWEGPIVRSPIARWKRVTETVPPSDTVVWNASTFTHLWSCPALADRDYKVWVTMRVGEGPPLYLNGGELRVMFAQNGIGGGGYTVERQVNNRLVGYDDYNGLLLILTAERNIRSNNSVIAKITLRGLDPYSISPFMLGCIDQVWPIEYSLGVAEGVSPSVDLMTARPVWWSMVDDLYWVGILTDSEWGVLVLDPSTGFGEYLPGDPIATMTFPYSQGVVGGGVASGGVGDYLVQVEEEVEHESYGTCYMIRARNPFAPREVVAECYFRSYNPAISENVFVPFCAQMHGYYLIVYAWRFLSSEQAPSGDAVAFWIDTTSLPTVIYGYGSGVEDLPTLSGESCYAGAYWDGSMHVIRFTMDGGAGTFVTTAVYTPDNGTIQTGETTETSADVSGWQWQRNNDHEPARPAVARGEGGDTFFYTKRTDNGVAVCWATQYDIDEPS